MDRQCQGMTDIEVLEKILGSLRITEEYILDENKTTELTTPEEILTVSVSTVMK